MERTEERVDRLGRKFEWFIEEMADFKVWVVRFLNDYRREVDRQIKEYREDTDRKIAEYRAETDKKIAEYRADTDRKIAEYRAETDRKIAEYREDTDRKIDEYRAETDRKIAEYREETDRKIDEYREEHRKELREANKRWGEISNKMGTIVEDLIFPALKPVIKKYFKCNPTKTYQRLEYEDEDRGIYEEFDGVAVCKDKVFLLEVKSTPREQHIERFKEKARRFLEYFPEFSDKKLILIMGSLNFSESFIRLLSQAGIYAMAYREWEYMDILNFEEVNAQGS